MDFNFRTMGKSICIWTIGIFLIGLCGIGIILFLTSGNTTDEMDDNIPKPRENSPVLIYTSKRGIDMFDLSTNISESLITTGPGVYSVSMDATHVYWANNANQGIYRAFKDGTAKEMIAFLGIEDPPEIAVDWITGNIYFLESLYNGLGVCTNTGSHCTLLGIIDSEEFFHAIQGFVLDPAAGEMYWSSAVPRISKGYMNGKSPVPMVTDDLGAPTGLTIDHPSSRLYWIDIKKGIIESINLDGTDRKSLLEVSRTSSIAVFGSRLFWNDEKTNDIYFCDKSTGTGNETLLQGDGPIHRIDIHSPISGLNSFNPCYDNPCGGICLLAGGGNYTCACSPDKILMDDEKTCQQIKYLHDQHLIIAAGGNLYDYHHKTLGKPHWQMINNYHHFYDIYNTHDMNLFDNTSQRLLNEFSSFFGGNGTLGGIAFDYIGYNLYSTNPQQRRIEIMSLSTLQKTFIEFDDEPRAILLIPKLSIMIISFCKNENCSVEKMSMIGSEREYLRNFTGESVSLAYDFKKGKLLLTDGAGIMEKICLDPSSRSCKSEEVSAEKNIVSLAVIGNTIFWTKKNTKKIFWSEETSSSVVVGNKIGLEGFNVTIPTDVDGMHFIQKIPSRYKGKLWEVHECRVDNGGCSHVCLVKSQKSYVCKCPSNMTLKSDLKTCVHV